MQKKHYFILLICLVVIATVLVCVKGFNVKLEYAESVSITIDLGQEFNKEDIKSITDEVFGEESVIIQPVEVYKDVVKITVKSASDEQLENLKTKINEKYSLEKEVSDLIVTQNANTKLSDTVSHYILPIVISFVIIHAYEFLRFNKLGYLNILYNTILPIAIIQILLACVYAICRIPIGSEALIISIVLYILSEYVVIKNLIKKSEIQDGNKAKKAQDPVRA